MPPGNKNLFILLSCASKYLIVSGGLCVWSYLALMSLGYFCQTQRLSTEQSILEWTTSTGNVCDGIIQLGEAPVHCVIFRLFGHRPSQKKSPIV